MPGPCGIMFRLDHHGPEDQEGCRLPDGHEGAHEFTTPEGAAYRWETDWECDCEHCQRCEGDYCMIYWEAKTRPAQTPGKVE